MKTPVYIYLAAGEEPVGNGLHISLDHLLRPRGGHSSDVLSLAFRSELRLALQRGSFLPG